MRNNQSMETKNAFSRPQRQPKRPQQKPRWQIEEEMKQAEEEEKRKQAERGLERTEENFPALGNAGAKPVTWSGRKFTEMAAEWKEETDREKEARELEEKRTDDSEFVLPRFRNMRRFAEPEERLDEIVEEKPVDEEGEWETVNRKVRKEKRELTFEELEEKYGGECDAAEDGTVWGGTEEHQTCWDERKY